MNKNEDHIPNTLNSISSVKSFKKPKKPTKSKKRNPSSNRSKSKLKNKDKGVWTSAENESLGQQQGGNSKLYSPIHSSRSITKKLLKEAHESGRDWSQDNLDLNFDRTKKSNKLMKKDRKLGTTFNLDEIRDSVETTYDKPMLEVKKTEKRANETETSENVYELDIKTKKRK